MFSSATACTYSSLGADSVTQSPAIETTSSDVEGAWVLVSGSGPEGEIEIVEDDPITFVVDPQGKAGGQAPCNEYGELTLDDGKVESTNGEGFATTLMLCRPASAAKAETAYYAALDGASAFELDGERLVLTGPSVELRFERS